MKFTGVGYSLLCIFVPLVWGLLVVLVSNRIETRLNRKEPMSAHKADKPSIDYHI